MQLPIIYQQLRTCHQKKSEISLSRNVQYRSEFPVHFLLSTGNLELYCTFPGQGNFTFFQCVLQRIILPKDYAPQKIYGKFCQAITPWVKSRLKCFFLIPVAFEGLYVDMHFVAINSLGGRDTHTHVMDKIYFQKSGHAGHGPTHTWLKNS